MKEFESRPITVEEYLRARDLMVEERNFIWTICEGDGFRNEHCAELIKAYDLVIDSMTCLAMDVAKSNVVH